MRQDKKSQEVLLIIISEVNRVDVNFLFNYQFVSINLRVQIEMRIDFEDLLLCYNYHYCYYCQLLITCPWNTVCDKIHETYMIEDTMFTKK